MRRVLLSLICMSLFVPAVQGAQKPHKSKNNAVIFQPDDRRVITEYFRNTSNLPPGLAKRGGNLPPGLQKQLRRNGARNQQPSARSAPTLVPATTRACDLHSDEGEHVVDADSARR